MNFYHYTRFVIFNCIEFLLENVRKSEFFNLSSFSQIDIGLIYEVCKLFFLCNFSPLTHTISYNPYAWLAVLESWSAHAQHDIVYLNSL